MSKGKQVMAMGVDQGEDDDDQNLKRKSRSPNQDSPKRLKIQQDLNFSPKQQEEEDSDSPKRLKIQQDLNRSPKEEEEEEEEEAAPNPEELLFEKVLTEKDTTQWRMLIKGGEDRRRVLQALREDEVNKAREKEGLSVATTDEYTLILRIDYYMTLQHQWSNITDKYKPKVGDSVQGFASRDAAHHLRLRLQFITN